MANSATAAPRSGHDRPRNSRRIPGIIQEGTKRPLRSMTPEGSTGSGGGIRTLDLWVMSPTSCRCSTPRRVDLDRSSPFHRRSRWNAPAAASPPRGSPPKYSPALRGVTTGFGMEPGGARALSATGACHMPLHSKNGETFRRHFVYKLRHNRIETRAFLPRRPRALHARFIDPALRWLFSRREGVHAERESTSLWREPPRCACCQRPGTE